MSDLDNKKLAVSTMQNIAKQMSDLADNTAAMQSLITARGWSNIQDSDVSDKGITAAQVLSFVGLMTQYNKLMAGTAVTTTQGRSITDAIKSL